MQNYSLEEQRRLIDELARLIADRAQTEQTVVASSQARDETTHSQFAAERERLERRCGLESDDLTSGQARKTGEVARQYEKGLEEAIRKADEIRRSSSRTCEDKVQQVRESSLNQRERAEQDCDAAVRDTSKALQDYKSKLELRNDEVDLLDTTVEKTMRRRRCWKAAQTLPEPEGHCDAGQPLEQFSEQFSFARAAADGFQQHWSARFLASGWLFAIFILAWTAAVVLGIAVEMLDQPWVIGSGAVAAAITAIIFVLMRPIMVRETLQQYSTFRQTVANSKKALEAARAVAVAEADKKRLLLMQHRDKLIQQAEEYRQTIQKQSNARRDQLVAEAEAELKATRQTLTGQRDRQLTELNESFEVERQKLEQQRVELVQDLEARYQQELAGSEETRSRSWTRLKERWEHGLQTFGKSIQEMNEFGGTHYPDWKTINWNSYDAPELMHPAVRFGQYTLALRDFEGGVSAYDELKTEQESFVIPAMATFAERPTLLWEAWGEGRDFASRSMQNVMLRLFTSLPPGKVRFTIIDPVGLGQNFSGFMHLADIDEQLVSHRIWTEPAHIQQRLSDLTEHMEDIIQTYLRNEFQSIDAYNRHAGEVAEPFRVLVVANFPAGFTDESAQRLLSIVNSGARCGVYVLISTDTKLEIPRHFDMTELESRAVSVQWDGQAFHWLDADLKDLALELDPPPSDELFTDVIKTVGQKAKEARRVEVPFSVVAPPRDGWWKEDSRGGIRVALGRAGATKLQYLGLGKGTSQHVLISGKTGSGKSTLLHALITNTALQYSPREVEFYLIDFKKGVEFKSYATYRLPHARVIAIESEREFGMSVLERLDHELKVRGDRFREIGVQDIHAYRDQRPEDWMPRVMLIIDEFQEFFVQDDKLAQDSALLLDRLVRQGRAFGIHVLLGSQTLAGAYSLARSTIGQMAVRIALQCSEADSHLILSEDNTAARLLNRPGEAIYNDANGLFEGNHPFQVVWLASDEQDAYLRQLRTLTNEEVQGGEPTIVFEGNVAAPLSSNRQLSEAWQGEQNGGPPRAWLGAAVAIKEPTSVRFPSQSGSNLLVVGQQEEAAAGILAATTLGLVATASETSNEEPASARVFVFDGTRAESTAGFDWNGLADMMPSVKTYRPREIPHALTEIHKDLKQRLADEDAAEKGSQFLVVYNLGRFRELRRADDDYGFGGFDEESMLSPAQQFAEIIREGPAVGMHVVIWSDTFNNVNRWFDRTLLRELGSRALLQMSATDSSNLMDSPAASRLGSHRAILFDEEQGTWEKFRPYGLPDQEWLKELCNGR